MAGVSIVGATSDHWVRRATNWWQAVVIMAPLLLLAGLGIRGLQATRQAVLDEARRQTERGLDRAWPALGVAWDDLIRSGPVLRLYPSPPIPVPPNEADRLYARALEPSASHDEATAALARLEAVFPEALAPSGIPLVPLAEWNRLRLETEPTGLPPRAAALRAAALRDHPSVLTPALLEAATKLLHEHGADPGPLATWQTEWDRDEKARAAWRQHADVLTSAGRSIWVVDPAGRSWWVRRTGDDGSTRQIFSLDALRDGLRTITDRVQSFLPDFAAIEFVLDDFPLTDSRGQPLASRKLDGLAIRIVVAFPERLFAQQRRQTAWLAALLVCAFAVALAGFWSMRRTLAHERRLSQLKSDFVSSVSHELRAPVAAMRLMAENLETGAVPTETRQREYHRHLAEECRRLGALIDNVLDFARIEQNHKMYAFAETDVNALVHDALALMQPRAAQRRQELTSDLQLIEPPPVCDGLAIRQALVNLLENAIKFSPEDTPIRVISRAASDSLWELSVHDDGPGIPSTEHEKVFERFYRLGSELRRETQGAGIGLSIVRHIAEAHGGRVRLESEAGKGATFTLVLPRHPPDSIEAR